MPYTSLPAAETPLYNHTLPDIEAWLSERGCQQDATALNQWRIERTAWEAEILLEVDSIVVRYLRAANDGSDIQRGFKYSLSRRDLNEAIFSGP
ncbi:MAG: DUF3143 domain-containing protein [Leptolyngbya sp. SIO4C1]|nr:DUF3143 domain-containing protein [Leptolyngbya sp. SIO4C1]